MHWLSFLFFICVPLRSSSKLEKWRRMNFHPSKVVPIFFDRCLTCRLLPQYLSWKSEKWWQPWVGEDLPCVLVHIQWRKLALLWGIYWYSLILHGKHFFSSCNLFSLVLFTSLISADQSVERKVPCIHTMWPWQRRKLQRGKRQKLVSHWLYVALHQQTTAENEFASFVFCRI